MKVFGLVEKHGLLDRFYHRVHGDGPDFAPPRLQVSNGNVHLREEKHNELY